MLRGTDRHRDRADARDFLGRSRAGGEERGSPEPQMEPFARAARTQGRTAAQPRGLDRRTTAREGNTALILPPPTHTSLSPSRARAAPRTRAARAKRDMQRRAQRATHLAAKPPRRHTSPPAASGKLVARFARPRALLFLPPPATRPLSCAGSEEARYGTTHTGIRGARAWSRRRRAAAGGRPTPSASPTLISHKIVDKNGHG